MPAIVGALLCYTLLQSKFETRQRFLKFHITKNPLLVQKTFVITGFHKALRCSGNSVFGTPIQGQSVSKGLSDNRSAQLVSATDLASGENKAMRNKEVKYAVGSDSGQIGDMSVNTKASGVSVRPPTITCPESHTLVHRAGEYPLCQQQIDTPPSYSCPRGFSLSLKTSALPVHGPSAHNGPVCVKMYPAPRRCPSGYTMKHQSIRFQEDYVLCEKALVQPPSPTCPPGFQLTTVASPSAATVAPNMCRRVAYQNPVAVCSKGRLIENRCEWEIFSDIERTRSCEKDEFLIDNECVKRISRCPTTRSQRQERSLRMAAISRSAPLQSKLDVTNELKKNAQMIKIRVASHPMNSTNLETTITESKTPTLRHLGQLDATLGNLFSFLKVPPPPKPLALLGSKNSKNSAEEYQEIIVDSNSSTNSTWNDGGVGPSTFEEYADAHETLGLALRQIVESRRKTPLENDRAMPIETEWTTASSWIVDKPNASEHDDISSDCNDSGPNAQLLRRPATFIDQCAVGYTLKPALEGYRCSKTIQEMPRLICPNVENRGASFSRELHEQPTGDKAENTVQWGTDHRLTPGTGTAENSDIFLADIIKPVSNRPKSLKLSSKRKNSSWAKRPAKTRSLQAQTANDGSCSFVEYIEPWWSCAEGFLTELGKDKHDASCSLVLQRFDALGQCPEGTESYGPHCVEFTQAQPVCTIDDAKDPYPFDPQQLRNSTLRSETQTPVATLVYLPSGPACRFTRQVPPTVEVVTSCIGYSCIAYMT